MPTGTAPRGGAQRLGASVFPLVLLLALVVVGSGVFTLFQPDGQRGRPTEQAGRLSEVVVASGRSFDAPWTLTARRSGRRFCLDLVQPRIRATTGSCWISRSSGIQILPVPVGSGIAYFGPAPAKTHTVQLVLQDGRGVNAEVFSVRGGLNLPIKVYLAPLARRGSGDVVAIDGRGRLVDHASFSTTGEAGRLVGVVDDYGNVIAYVPIGDWDLPPPGRDAPLDEIRLFASAPLSRLHVETRRWWDERPQQTANDNAFRRWWASYPVRHTLPTLAPAVGQ